MEVDLGGDDARADDAVRVGDGHGGLVAGGLDGENERARRGDGGTRFVGAGRRLDGPRANGGTRRGVVIGVRGGIEVGKRQVGAHDARIVAGTVVVGADARLGEAEATVELLGGVVSDLDLKRRPRGIEHLCVVGDARDQARGDALAAAVHGHGDVRDLQLVAYDGAARIADDAAAVVRDPPHVVVRGHVVVEDVLGPRLVVRGSKDLGLELRDGVDVVDGHGPQLAVDIRERVIAAGELHGRGLLQAEARALVLLRVGKARVDGQHERRVAGLLVKGPGLRRGAREPLARGPPGILGREPPIAKACGLELRAVLCQPVAREHELPRVRAGGPLRHARVGLDNGLGRERAVRTGLVQPVDARIDLAAHGIARDRERPAHARRMRGPGHRVEGRRAVERKRRAASQALCRRDADANAREGAGAAPHEDGVEVGHG